MTIKTKVTLFTSLFLILMVSLITLMSINSIKQQGQQRLDNYRIEAKQNVKLHLKDMVDLAYSNLDRNYQNLSDLSYLSKFYQYRLNSIIDTGESIINKYKAKAANGQMSLSGAKRYALKEIKQLRFDNGNGYIWVNDSSRPYPKMLMHPANPALDGKIMSDEKYNNALGSKKNLFRAFVDVTRKQNDGYVDYLWPKPSQQDPNNFAEKISYVRKISDWDWILGTGIYLDDAKREIQKLMQANIKTLRYDNGQGYFWINDNSLPYPKMVMHPIAPELDGKTLDDQKFNSALGANKNLFQAINLITSQNQDGAGFVDYLWPKPGQASHRRFNKISYVRLHKPSGWIVGSGVYIDNIEAEIVAKQEQINQHIQQLLNYSVIAAVIFILIAVAISYQFAETLSKPIRSLTQVAEQISKGKNLDQTINEAQRNDEIGDLARSIERLKTSVSIMLKRLKK